MVVFMLLICKDKYFFGVDDFQTDIFVFNAIVERLCLESILCTLRRFIPLGHNIYSIGTLHLFYWDIATTL